MRGDSIRVEKVEPDPLNLLVNTDVGSNSDNSCAFLYSENALFYIYICEGTAKLKKIRPDLLT